VHWVSQQLPIPQSAWQQAGREVSVPQFVGNTTFLEVSDDPDVAFHFVRKDAGASCRTIVMPSGAGPYPREQFFGPAEWIAVSADGAPIMY
jgi:hypothetical protein